MPDPIVISRPSSLGLRDFPHIFIPRNAIEFSRVGFKSGITTGQTFTLNRGQDVLIPVKHRGYLKQIAVGLSAYGNGQVWNLLLNGTAVRDYVSVPAPIGSPETPVDRTISLGSQQRLSLSFTNPFSTALSVTWALYGWYFPE